MFYVGIDIAKVSHYWLHRSRIRCRQL